MTWLNQLRATAKQAAAAARELDTAMTADERYAAVRQSTLQQAAAARNKTRGLREEFAETAAGEKVGSGARKVGEVLGKLPVVTAIGDSLAGRVGLPELLDLRIERPDDAWPLVWLAEALTTLRRDRNAFLAVRTVLEPVSGMAGGTLRAAGAVGAVDTVELLQRAAWNIGLRRAGADPNDLDAMHVLARVYLLRGFTEPAAKLSAVAALGVAPESGLALTTTAKALAALGRTDEAADAARAAVREGCSVGNEVLADLALADGDRRRYVALRDEIVAADVVRYRGVAVDAGGLVIGVCSAQADRTKALAQRVQGRRKEQLA